MCDLKGKVILVTGAGRGIGNAICKRLYNLGAKVIAVSRGAETLKELEKELPEIKTVCVDIADWQKTRESLTNDVKEELDGLVNNAGIAIIKPFSELTEKDFDDTFNVNIRGVFNVTQTLLPKMKDGSAVVSLSSLASLRAFDGHAVYSATKAGVDSLTKSLALEYGSRKIRFNTVNPTVVLTQMGKANWSDPAKATPMLNHIPLHRFGEVDEIVNAIVFLLSSSSSFINGHHLPLEGGYSVS